MEKRIRVGHSPDPDDAFMFWAIATGRVRIDEYKIEHVLEDIQSLNRRALAGELEVTAASAGAYPYLADRYWVLESGAAMGRGYGPIVVSKKPLSPEDLRARGVAIPGRLTTAHLLLALRLGEVETVELDFAQILPAVETGEVEAGVIIHEGQLTYQEHRLVKVLDLGEWWAEETELPLPLGLDLVRSDLGEEVAREVSRALRESIEAAYGEEEEALAYALQFGRGMDRETCRRFIKMYVNEDTLSLGEEGRTALRELYRRAADAGLIPQVPALVVV